MAITQLGMKDQQSVGQIVIEHGYKSVSLLASVVSGKPRLDPIVNDLLSTCNHRFNTKNAF